MSLQSAVVNSDVRVTAALGVFPDTVTASLIAPGTNMHEDWMYWEFFSSVAGTTSEFARVNMWPIDVRARRRHDELQQQLMLGLQNHNAVNAVFVQYSLSVLLALP